MFLLSNLEVPFTYNAKVRIRMKESISYEFLYCLPLGYTWLFNHVETFDSKVSSQDSWLTGQNCPSSQSVGGFVISVGGFVISDTLGSGSTVSCRHLSFSPPTNKLSLIASQKSRVWPKLLEVKNFGRKFYNSDTLIINHERERS